MLKTGGEYNEAHVQWLSKQVPEIICLSDVDVYGVKTIKLKHDWPGWWSKMALFDPDLLDDDLLFYDLDTVVIEQIIPDGSCSLMLEDFYVPERSGSGFMYIRHADKHLVWDAWIKSPEKGMNYKPTKLHHGDQGFIMDHLPHRRWQEFYPGMVMSYKVHIINCVKPAGVVCFHGQPRPWNVLAKWVPLM